MIISVIGTNGFLSDKIGQYCNTEDIILMSYGISEPKKHYCNRFISINLEKMNIDFELLAQSDMIIYASGAGIQSNMNDSYDLIYSLNTFVPIEICSKLSDIGFKGMFVTFGSYFEIGNNCKNIKFNEFELASSALNVPNHYCVSKRLLTRYVNSSFLNIRHLHVILPTIYGDGESTHRIIPYTINALKKGISQSFTSGYQIRQYLYAGDIPKILIDLFKINYCGILNLSGVDTFSIRQLVETIYHNFGGSLDISIFGKEDRGDVEMKCLQLDSSLLNSLLPNIKYTLLSEALKFYE